METPDSIQKNLARPVLLQIIAASRHYLMGEVVVEALKSSSLNIYEGEFLAILGPSGSGKSTLLNLMGGMDRPTYGQIIYKGSDIAQFNDKELTDFRRKELGFVFQFYNLIPDLTAEENVALAAQLVDNPLPVDFVLDQVGLLERKHHFPAQMSGGEQQRVSIARAIVKKPRLLLCDEPTGALDYETGKLILSLLQKINREIKSTVVLITHNTPIGDMAERIVRMRSGEIVDVHINPHPLEPERIEW